MTHINTQTQSCCVCHTAITIELPSINWIACSSCNTSLRVTTNGLVSEGILPEDIPLLPSPITMQSKGRIKGKAFRVLGNVIFEHEDGTKRQEWLLIFSDNSLVWLEEFNQTFTLFAESYDMKDNIPNLEDVKIGEMTKIGPYEFVPDVYEESKVIMYRGQMSKHGTIGETYRYFEGRFRNYTASVEYKSRNRIELFFGVTLDAKDLELIEEE